MLTRRQFIQCTAAATALIGCPWANRAFATGSDNKLIPHATHFGPLQAEVRNGRFVKVKSVAADKHPQEMLYALADRVYAPNRIHYPCVRKSFLEGKQTPHLRGSEEFVRVSWDAALDLLAQKLDNARNDFGNESIFLPAYSNWAQTGLINRPYNLHARLMNLIGGFTDTVGDYSAGAAQHTLPYVLGSMEVYSQQTSEFEIEANTKLMLLWGADPLKTLRIASRVPDHNMIDAFHRFKRKSMTFVSLDPKYSESAEKLGAEWLAVRPGSDTALVHALCYELYTRNLHDAKFLEEYTVGFNLFRDYLLGKADGTVKSAEWAAPICGLPVETIRNLALRLVKQRTLIATNWACQRSEHGEQFHWSIVTLAAMIGQIGLPGGGFAFALHYAGGGSPTSGHPMPRPVPVGRRQVRSLIPASRIGEVLRYPGKTVDFKGQKLTYPNIRTLYIAGVNPIGYHQDTNELIQGIRTLDLVVSQDPWWTASARHADIVLPTTTTFERNDLCYGNTFSRSHIWAMKKVIEPLHEARDDYWIFTQLARRFGVEERYTLGRSQLDWVKHSYDLSQTGVSFDDFWQKGVVELPIPEANKRYVRYGKFRQNPEKHALRTPSGKIEIFSEKIASFGYRCCPGHPAWLPSKEGPDSTLARKHPFQLISPHPTHRLHSQLDNTPLRHSYKIDNREPVLINSADAASLQISQGDLVEIHNDRGRVLAGAQPTDHIRPGVVAIDEGAWYSAENPTDPDSRCNSGHVNVLTSSRASSKLAQATTANTCMVSLRKVDPQKIEPNQAYSSPVILKLDT